MGRAAAAVFLWDALANGQLCRPAAAHPRESCEHHRATWTAERGGHDRTLRNDLPSTWSRRSASSIRTSTT